MNFIILLNSKIMNFHKIEFNSNNLYPVPSKLVDEMTRQSSITNIKRKGKDIIAQGKFIEMPLET